MKGHAHQTQLRNKQPAGPLPLCWVGKYRKGGGRSMEGKKTRRMQGEKSINLEVQAQRN